jgi:hypothetical protein
MEDAMAQAATAGTMIGKPLIESDRVEGTTSPLPPEVHLSTGIASNSKGSEAGTRLIKFLTSPAAAPAVSNSGLEPIVSAGHPGFASLSSCWARDPLKVKTIVLSRWDTRAGKPNDCVGEFLSHFLAKPLIEKDCSSPLGSASKFNRLAAD